MTNPKNILTTLHLIRAGLASGLLTKEVVINWADKIIIKEEEPDIFFIDLSLSVSKSTNDVIYYLSDYLNFENPAVSARPLVGLLYKLYKEKQIDLEQTVSKLFSLKFEAVFSDKEETYIYLINDAFDCARDGIYGTMESVQKETEKFLSFYKDYSMDNFEQWNELDIRVEEEMEADYIIGQKQRNIDAQTLALPKNPWWKFW